MWNSFMRLRVCGRIGENGQDFGEGTDEDWEEHLFTR